MKRIALGQWPHLVRRDWAQLYKDNGLKREKLVSVKPPPGIDAVYSLRITQFRRCTAYRDGEYMRFLTIAGDHDSTIGRKKSPVKYLTRVWSINATCLWRITMHADAFNAVVLCSGESTGSIGHAVRHR